MLQNNRSYTAGTAKYRYGFNGKENDSSINGNGVDYDYGFRIYDARVGKFLSVDPLTAKYPELTPYQFASNKPINSIDQDGLESIDAIRAQQAKYHSMLLFQTNQPLSPPKVVVQPVHSEAIPESVRTVMARVHNEQNVIIPAPAPPPVISAYDIPTGDVAKDEEDRRVARLNVENGLNADGSKLFIDRIRENPHIRKGLDNVIIPLATAAAADGLGRLFFAADAIASNAVAKGGDNIVYRALTSENSQSFAAGRGIFAKAPDGSWTLEDHLIHGSSAKSFTNDPWIATSTDINIAKSFSSSNGVAEIDLSKISSSSIQKGWMNLPRSSAGYHYSVWQQEVSIFGQIPQSAIKKIK